MKTSSNLRKLLVLLILSSLSMTVMNCSKADSDEPSAQIVGTWKITNLFVKEGSAAEEDFFPQLILIVPCFKDISFTFKSNGDLTGSVPVACQDNSEDYIGTSGTAKYEVNGGKLIITDADGSKSEQNVSFSGSQMSWTSSEVDAGVTTTTRLVFTKQ
ncbi:MAG: lipocalin family protein [Emticicia sp.]